MVPRTVLRDCVACEAVANSDADAKITMSDFIFFVLATDVLQETDHIG